MANFYKENPYVYKISLSCFVSDRFIAETFFLSFRIEEENHKLLSRLEHTKKEFETHSQLTENDLSKLKRLEDEIFHLNSHLKKSDRKLEVSFSILVYVCK